MEDRIKARIAEIEQAEREAITRLSAIQTVLVELRALLAPAQAELSGDDLGDQSA